MMGLQIFRRDLSTRMQNKARLAWRFFSLLTLLILLRENQHGFFFFCVKKIHADFCVLILFCITRPCETVPHEVVNQDVYLPGMWRTSTIRRYKYVPAKQSHNITYNITYNIACECRVSVHACGYETRRTTVVVLVVVEKLEKKKTRRLIPAVSKSFHSTSRTTLIGWY